MLRSLESVARERDLFSLCVAGDPMFAAAWAWLGRCCRFLEKFNFAMLGAAPESVGLLQRARVEGLTASPHTLAHDEAFASLRKRDDFQRELDHARTVERQGRRALERAGGAHLVRAR